MKSIKDLEQNILKVVEEEADNMKLQSKIIDSFLNKGLTANVVYELFSNNIDIVNLTNMELICLTKYLDKNYPKNLIKIENVKDKENIFNPSEYFSNTELSDYDLFIPRQEEILEIAKFESCIKIDAKNFLCYMTAKELDTLRKNRLVAYFKNIQRANKIKKLKNGKIRRYENVNKEAVKELRERFIRKDIRPTAIALAVLEQSGKERNYMFKSSDNTNIGTLIIKPDFNVNSDSYQPLIIPDGYHRYTAICDAYEQSGVENGLGVFIHIMDEAEAKQYVNDVFKRSDTDIEWIQAMDQNDASKFVDDLVKKSKILKDEVVNTYSEIKKFNALVDKNTLVDSVRYTDLKIGNTLTRELDSETMAKIIDMLLDFIVENDYEGNFEEFKKSEYSEFKMFIGYMAIANELKNDGEYKKKLITIANGLKDNIHILNKTLGIRHKNSNNEAIYRYFENLCKEV